MEQNVEYLSAQYGGHKLTNLFYGISTKHS